ncbi:MAG: hypothetical protein SNJ63_08090 [Sphingomonadaceae bacterium]
MAWALPADLAERARASLEHAASALALTAAPPEGLDLEALEAPPDKVVAEVAILVREALAAPDELLRAQALTLVPALAARGRSARLLVGLALRPSAARDIALPHILLARAGHGDEAFEAALARSLASPLADAHERLPYRALEQAWAERLRTGDAAGPGLPAGGILRSGPDLAGGSRDDLYALTHALAYASDFGRWQLPQAVDRAHLQQAIDSALARVLAGDDFDLAAELSSMNVEKMCASM